MLLASPDYRSASLGAISIMMITKKVAFFCIIKVVTHLPLLHHHLYNTSNRLLLVIFAGGEISRAAILLMVRIVEYSALLLMIPYLCIETLSVRYD